MFEIIFLNLFLSKKSWFFHGNVLHKNVPSKRCSKSTMSVVFCGCLGFDLVSIRIDVIDAEIRRRPINCVASARDRVVNAAKVSKVHVKIMSTTTLLHSTHTQCLCSKYQHYVILRWIYYRRAKVCELERTLGQMSSPHKHTHTWGLGSSRRNEPPYRPVVGQRVQCKDTPKQA